MPRYATKEIVDGRPRLVIKRRKFRPQEIGAIAKYRRSRFLADVRRREAASRNSDSPNG